MKKVLLALVGLMTLVSLNASSEIPNVAELRVKANYLAHQIETLASQCDQRIDNTNHFSMGLADIKQQVISIIEGQKQQGKTVNATRLLELLDLAQKILTGLETDCLNGTVYSKILLEMYMTNIETELMILQYGVDSIGYRN